MLKTSKKIVAEKISDALSECLHGIYEENRITKGDITPCQQLKWDDLCREMADLMMSLIRQNASWQEEMTGSVIGLSFSQIEEVLKAETGKDYEIVINPDDGTYEAVCPEDEYILASDVDALISRHYDKEEGFFTGYQVERVLMTDTEGGVLFVHKECNKNSA